MPNSSALLAADRHYISAEPSSKVVHNIQNVPGCLNLFQSLPLLKSLGEVPLTTMSEEVLNGTSLKSALLGLIEISSQHLQHHMDFLARHAFAFFSTSPLS